MLGVGSIWVSAGTGFCGSVADLGTFFPLAKEELIPFKGRLGFHEMGKGKELV
jgi:hypothetical protein